MENEKKKKRNLLRHTKVYISIINYCMHESALI